MALNRSTVAKVAMLLLVFVACQQLVGSPMDNRASAGSPVLGVDYGASW